MKNFVILTHGWTGSSLFASLLGQAGYWLGDDTARKPDYDTFENHELVMLNAQLLREMLPEMNHEHEFDASHVQRLERLSHQLDVTPYRRFVEHCQAHGPWLWKDPRLTWTMPFWARLIDLEQTSFLVLTRETCQAWVTANLRRHIQSLRFTRRYNDGITQFNLGFLQAHGLSYLTLSFEDLLVRPRHTLDRLNQAFGLELTMAQLHGVCRQPLYRKSRGLKDHLKAGLIYLKNFRERDGRGRLGRQSMPSAPDMASVTPADPLP